MRKTKPTRYTIKKKYRYRPYSHGACILLGRYTLNKHRHKNMNINLIK